LYLLVLVQTLEGTSKRNDTPLDVEPEPRENVPEDEPMDSCSDYPEDHEMEEEDENGSAYETETETTESEIEDDLDKETG
jgi:hypothetical protein